MKCAIMVAKVAPSGGKSGCLISIKVGMLSRIFKNKVSLKSYSTLYMFMENIISRI